MNKIYEYDDNVIVEDRTTVPIRIVEGEYEGLLYQYGTIKFIEEDDNFTYNLIENPNEVKEDQDFVNQLGEILVEVLNDEIQETNDDFLREMESSNSEDSWTCNFRKLIV